MFFSGLKKKAPLELAIDLGTANARVHVMGKGLVAETPSCIKTPVLTPFPSTNESSGSRVFPLSGGAITQPEAAIILLQSLIQRALNGSMTSGRVLLCSPSDITKKEKNLLVEAAHKSGAVSVSVVSEPLAAAVGAGVDISSSHARMIIDIGDGVTDMAVLRSGQIIHSQALRKGCSDLHRAVQTFLAKKHGLYVSYEEAEKKVIQFGMRREKLAEEFSVAGIKRDQNSSLVIPRLELWLAMKPVMKEILGFIGKALYELPSEEGIEVIESGLCVTGGGACLPGMTDLIAETTKVEVTKPTDPLHAVIQGAGAMLQVADQTGLWTDC